MGLGVLLLVASVALVIGAAFAGGLLVLCVYTLGKAALRAFLNGGS